MIHLASCIRGILCDVALCTIMYDVWYNRTLPTQEVQCSPGKSRSLFRLRPSAGASNQSKPILKASILLSSERREGTNQATCTSFIPLPLTNTAIPMTLVKRYMPRRKVSMSDSPNPLIWTPRQHRLDQSRLLYSLGPVQIDRPWG